MTCVPQTEEQVPGWQLGYFSGDDYKKKTQLVENIVQKKKSIRSIAAVCVRYIHDQGVVFKTVSQPNKIIVPPPYRGSLLSKAHAVCLQSTQKLIRLGKKIPKKIKSRGTLTWRETS